MQSRLTHIAMCRPVPIRSEAPTASGRYCYLCEMEDASPSQDLARRPQNTTAAFVLWAIEEGSWMEEGS